MSCNGDCKGCQSDCGKRPLRHPSITGAILSQFMMDMYQRSQASAKGELTEEKMDEIDRKVLNWLGATFTGKNEQFELDAEWYPNGLAGNLRFKLGNELAQASGGKLPDDNNFFLPLRCLWQKSITRFLNFPKRVLNPLVKMLPLKCCFCGSVGRSY